MGKIKVHEFTTLDGSVSAPMWTVPFPWTPEQTEETIAMNADATAILLGRTTYEMFAPAWSQRTVEDDPGAPFFNDTPKYVVGAQPPNVEWGPVTRLGAYDPEVIRRLKDDTEGTIYISGSGTLVRALLHDGLVDDLHLFVYPIAVGQGQRLWGDGVEATKLKLTAQEVYDNGVVHLNYGPV
jgi:dihydrofolate reductase